MITFPPLEAGKYYHIFNRGNNKENLFREPCNNEYFLNRACHHLLPALSILAYCLLRNHFHLSVRVKDWDEQVAWAHRRRPRLIRRLSLGPLDPSLQLSHLFNGYAKAMNKKYVRIGSLFQERFRRIELEDGEAIRAVVRYVHRNPENHGLCDDFRKYEFSSYSDILQSQGRLVDRSMVLAWFGGLAGFITDHERSHDVHEAEQLCRMNDVYYPGQI